MYKYAVFDILKINAIRVVNTELQVVFEKYQKTLPCAHCKFIYFV